MLLFLLLSHYLLLLLLCKENTRRRHGEDRKSAPCRKPECSDANDGATGATRRRPEWSGVRPNDDLRKKIVSNEPTIPPLSNLLRSTKHGSRRSACILLEFCIFSVGGQQQQTTARDHHHHRRLHRQPRSSSSSDAAAAAATRRHRVTDTRRL